MQNSNSVQYKELSPKWIGVALNKMFVFSGRSGRREFWSVYLWTRLASIILTFFLAFLMFFAGLDVFTYIFLSLGATFLLSVPIISLSVRRMHDTGRSGWWCLVVFTPSAGEIILLVFMALEGTKGENLYGPPVA